MMRVALIILGVVLCAWSPACAMFTVSDGEHVYFANNEDCTSAGEVWFVPGKGGRLGRVNVGFDNFAQGSMNERGLCFDCAALPEVPWKPDPKKKDTKNLLELIMERCGTVPEALAMFDEYNCTHLASGQFMFADATGACAVVTWDPKNHISIVKTNGNHLLITNDRLEWSGLRDPRYVLAERMLRSMPAVTLDACKETLSAIHQEGKDAFTSYSNVFEPKAGRIHLCNLAKFDEDVTLDLAGELKKGAHKLRLADLFKTSPNLEAYRAQPVRVIPSEVKLSPEVLARYVGRYEVTEPAVVVEIALDGDRGLLFKIAGQSAAALFPEDEREFRFRDTFGTLSFKTADDGKVEGFTLHRPGDSFARRVEAH